MIRVGGNSADESAYIPTGDLPNGTTYRITDADLDAYVATVPAWNGSLVIGTTLRYQGAQGSALDVAHVTAVAKRVGFDLVEGVELGNEVDLFFENQIRDPSYVYNTHKPEFKLANDAVAPVLAAAGRPVIQGATWCSEHWTTQNMSDYVASFGASFGSISLHRYAASVCHNDKATIEELMADKAAAGLAAALVPWVAPAIAASIPIYIGEGNSVSCGGAKGVSDVWASALWSLDVLFSVASIGIKRWSFHGMPEGAYSTIIFPSGSDDVAQVQPLFYGLWAFATATANSAEIRAVTTVHNSNAFIKAWSVTDRLGETRVVVLHKDPAASANATITISPLGPLNGQATLVRGLPGARGIASTWSDAISFGGLSFASTSNGVPSGAPTSEKISANGGGDFSFALPPASFAILTLPSS